MAISVIIPSALRKAPDGEYWLLKALRSVHAQTLQPLHIEIAIHEPKLPVEIADYLLQHTSPLVYLTECPVRSQVVSTNKACRLAKGDYYAFLEDDDVWEPEHLEVMMRHMESAPVDFVTASQQIYTFDGAKLKPFHFPTTSSWLISSAFWHKLGGFDETFHIHHDNDFLGKAGNNRLHITPPIGPAQDAAGLLYVMMSGAFVRLDQSMSRFTVRRTHNEGGILNAVREGGEAATISQKEYAICNSRYGRTPW